MAGKEKSEECALCFEDGKLCRSHIFPEFMYEKSYDREGRYVGLSSHPHHNPRLFQVGARERLLCQGCETNLSRWENYASQLLKKIDSIPTQGRRGAEVKYDYQQFKLFGISLLWRSHVSTRSEYKEFSVGPLEEDMRRMLLDGDPGRKRMCPFAISRYVGSEAAQQTMHMPVNIKTGGQHYAYFPAFGYDWLFVVSRRSHTIPDSAPYVGFSPYLVVPFRQTSDRQFLERLKTKMSPEML